VNQYKDFATVYDELIYSDIDYNKWADVIISIVEGMKLQKQDYLDLACGTGNLTVKVGKHYRNVWGVDLSNQMLTEAESKLREMGIKAKLICQDICSLKLNQKFDLITCALDSINYIIENEDLERLFDNVLLHLKDDGVFIFDINSYYKLTEILGNNLYTYDEDDVVYIWENTLENDLVNMNLTFFVKENKLYRRFDEEHVERAYKDEFIESLLNKKGFKIVNKLNNYEYKVLDDACERIVYVVRKETQEGI
jgi:SAM-dependent methyltransferase